MIYLPEFPEMIRPKLKDPSGLSQEFLHFIFPADVPRSELADLTVAGVGTYQQAAILGYRLCGDPENKKLHTVFQESTRQLEKRWLDESILPSDLPALFGIALGLSIVSDQLLTQWFHNVLLDELPMQEKEKGLGTFLRVISEPGHLNIYTIRCLEYRLFLITHPIYRAFQSIGPDGDQIPTSYEQNLRSYFIRRRKLPAMTESPGKNDEPGFFQSMLSVYIMDRCLLMSVWDTEAVKKLRESVLQPVRERITRKVNRSSTLIALVVVTALTTGLIYTSFQFFQYLRESTTAQTQWDTFEKAFYAFGGPIALVVLVGRTILSLLKRREFTFEVEKLADWLSRKRLSRKLKAMGLEPGTH